MDLSDKKVKHGEINWAECKTVSKSTVFEFTQTLDVIEEIKSPIQILNNKK